MNVTPKAANINLSSNPMMTQPQPQPQTTKPTTNYQQMMNPNTQSMINGNNQQRMISNQSMMTSNQQMVTSSTNNQQIVTSVQTNQSMITSQYIAQRATTPTAVEKEMSHFVDNQDFSNMHLRSQAKVPNYFQNQAPVQPVAPRSKPIFIEQHLGKKMSLLSTGNKIYHGELYTVDRTEKAIALHQVSCDGSKYEFLIFKDEIIRKLWIDPSGYHKMNITNKYVEGVFYGY